MKKILSAQLAAAAALTALTAPAAHAQSNVTISGMIDIGVYRDTAKAWNVGPIQRSNLAFSGSEDLGGGLSAIFKLSHRFNPDTGSQESASKPFWHGESTVGLKGAFGTVQLGRRLDAMYANDWAFDPWYNFDRVASPAWDLWHYNFPSDPHGNSGTAEYGRLNNGIFYDSPNLSGFSLSLSASPETSAGDANKPFAAALQYAGNGFAAMLAHGKNSAAGTDDFVGLKGSFGDFGAMGVYNVSKAGGSKAKTATLGAMYAIGVTTLKLGWGQVDLDGTKAEKIASAGALYGLSKRTSVYADFAHKTFPDRSVNVYGVGLTHAF